MNFKTRIRITHYSALIVGSLGAISTIFFFGIKSICVILCILGMCISFSTIPLLED